jgi:hypothetical protein
MATMTMSMSKSTHSIVTLILKNNILWMSLKNDQGQYEISTKEEKLHLLYTYKQNFQCYSSMCWTQVYTAWKE